MSYLLIDTSAILFGFRNRRGVFDLAIERFRGSRPLLSKGIINELNKISLNKGERGACARAALLDIRLKRIEIDDSAAYPDTWIAEFGSRNGCAAVTNDTKLVKRLLYLNVKTYKLTKEGDFREISKHIG